MRKLLRETFIFQYYIRFTNWYIKSFKPVRGINNKVEIFARLHKVQIDVAGDNNSILIEAGSYLENCLLYIRGNSNKITISKDVKIFGGELWIEDSNSEIKIGTATSIQKAHLAVTENNKKISIGANCMLSTDIEIRTGDSHSIIDLDGNRRINYAEDVYLDDHVWIGSKVSILKGVTIGPNSIIGTGSIVTKSIPANSLAVGIPAKVVKSNISWDKNRI